jgi:hypothetical protein
MFKARVGDVVIGTCPCPPSPACPTTGIIASGNPTELSGGSSIARVGDIVVFPCGVSVITTGSIMHLSGGSSIATLGSVVNGVGNGIVVTGNPTDLLT